MHDAHHHTDPFMYQHFGTGPVIYVTGISPSNTHVMTWCTIKDRRDLRKCLNTQYPDRYPHTLPTADKDSYERHLSD